MFDAAVAGEGADGGFDAFEVGAAQLEEVGGGVDVDVEDAVVPLAGAGGLDDLGGHDAGPRAGEFVEPRRVVDLEGLEGFLDKGGEGLGLLAGFGRVGVDGKAGDDVAEEPADAAVAGDVARGELAAVGGGGDEEVGLVRLAVEEG